MADMPNTDRRPHDDPGICRPLGSAGAHPVAQDRREVIVSQVYIHAPVEAVWSALTEPDHLSRWFAIVNDDWARPGAECSLDFEDGEHFWCHFVTADSPGPGGPATLVYVWRWNGVGPAATVTWALTPLDDVTQVTVTEETTNGPSDWRSWNGMGWPGILDQLADHLRTGGNTRWPWRRMGPYVQTVLPHPTYAVWAAGTSIDAAAFWLGRTAGRLETGSAVDITLGDASGTAQLTPTSILEPGQQFPSYQPSMAFDLNRGGWPHPLRGFLWLEPAGLNETLIQVFHQGWEGFGDGHTAPADRPIVTNYWVGAFRRLGFLLGPATGPYGGAGETNTGPVRDAGPHGWSA